MSKPILRAKRGRPRSKVRRIAIKTTISPCTADILRMSGVPAGRLLDRAVIELPLWP